MSGLTAAAFTAIDMTVSQGMPTLSTQASPDVVLGGSVVRLGPSERSGGRCATDRHRPVQAVRAQRRHLHGTPRLPVHEPSRAASPTTATATSGLYTPPQPGIYRFVATYNGDVNYAR